MKSAILIAAFIWAATSPGLPRRVRWYFLTQVISAIALETLVVFRVPVNADGYEIAYTVCTLGVLVSGFYLAWEALKSWRVKLRVLFLIELIGAAAIIFYMCMLAILADYHQFPYFLWITLGEATLLIISGGSLVISAVNLMVRDRIIAGTLATAWIAKAGILYLYSLNILSREQLWYDLGAFLPAMLFIVTCVWLRSKLKSIDKAENNQAMKAAA